MMEKIKEELTTEITINVIIKEEMEALKNLDFQRRKSIV
jgi:hypothetical protein